MFFIQKRYVVLCAGGLIAALAAVAPGTLTGDETPVSRRALAYVVCGDDRFQDNRVYRVDLLAGEMQGISDPIPRLGNPAKIAHDPGHSRLYIASMRGNASAYWPVTVVRAVGSEFEVLNRFSTNSGEGLNEGGIGHGYEGEYEAYNIVVSPDGNELYVAHGGLATSSFLTSVWDADTGVVLRQLPTGISGDYHPWSNDGRQVANRWPSYTWEEEQDGRIATKVRPGGLTIRDVQTGQQITTYPEDAEGLHPPWGRIDEPLTFNNPMQWEMMHIHDRDTGEIISEFDIQELTGLQLQSNPIGDRSAVLKGGRLLAVAMRTDQSQRLWDGNEAGSDYPSYIVLIDMLEQREITRTQVGLRCSNAVVAYE